MMGTDSSNFEDNGKRAQRRFIRTGRTVEKKQLSDSFVDPFKVSGGVSFIISPIKNEWILSHGKGINKCLHEPLSENEERTKPWLDPKKDAKVLKTLAQVHLDQRLLNRVDYYLNFRSTAELEVFHQNILMYCAKRFSYTPPVYRIWNELAALDHNIHSDRGVMRNREGEIVYHRCYNKKKWQMDRLPLKREKNISPHQGSYSESPHLLT